MAIFIALICYAVSLGCKDGSTTDAVVHTPGHFETVTTTTTTVVEEYDDGRPPMTQVFTNENVSQEFPGQSSGLNCKSSAPVFDAPPKYDELYK